MTAAAHRAIGAETSPIIGCLGDLMNVVDGGRLPEPHDTRMLSTRDARLGGTALNLAFHLCALGRDARLIAACGRREAAALEDALRPSGASGQFVSRADGATDLLTIFHDEAATRSFYLLEPLPREILDEMITRALGCDWLVFGGSRHPELSRALGDCFREGSRKLAFAPSYAVRNMEPDLVLACLEYASVIVLNEHETEFVRSRGAGRPLDDEAKTFVCTRAERGATIRAGADLFEIASVSGIHGDRLGAGDAFFAGYLHGLLAGGDARRAGLCAARAAAAIVRACDERALLDRAHVEGR